MIGAHCNLKHRFARDFLTLEDEQIIYSTRQHWMILLPHVMLEGIIIFIIFSLVSFVYFVLPSYFFTSIIIGIIFATVALEVLIKELIDWFFHFYIITNRKIIEVTYSPLFSRRINEVLLDQVRCTEVDVEMRGFFSEVLNIGNLILTFDRPTHEEMFALKRIKDPRRIAMHLGDSFESQYTLNQNRLWYKPRKKKNIPYRFIEELYPETNYQLGGNI